MYIDLGKLHKKKIQKINLSKDPVQRPPVSHGNDKLRSQGMENKFDRIAVCIQGGQISEKNRDSYLIRAWKRR